MSYLEKNIPKIDLHGETRETAAILTEEFINDNYKLGHREVIIIHGIGEGILKKEVHNMLKNNKKVLVYKLDNFNSGCTYVELRTSIDKNNKKCYNTQIVRGGY